MLTARRTRRRAFTLVEAVVATSITAVAGSALLLGINSSLKTTNDVLYQSVSAGLAQRLMDEIAGKLYCDPTAPYQYPLGPNAYESGSVCRERYYETGAYNGFTAQPPKDYWGVVIGTEDGQGGTRDPRFQISSTLFANWQQSVTVYYLNPANLSQALPAGQTSDYRAAEVKIYFKDPNQGTRLLATQRRVFPYVPPQ
ncbi:MAG: prepilin-type N-terminal cleavage/methylation domain-containing protein [Planctomycetia bacterium]|nr:prepilin-type N-terminal cleavage/methylation domain-containing protein [Planctomycetia bacterium]